MALLFGKEYSKDELFGRVGNLSQVCGTKLYDLADGPGKGVRGIDFKTGSGLDFSVMVDRGMDISKASWQGASLCWCSAVGEVSPYFYEPEGLGWLRSFFGGMLTTCGISFAGHPCEDEGVAYGLHGRASNIPARLVSLDGEWVGDEYTMQAKGVVEEVAVYNVKLRLTRTISAKLGANSFTIQDRIENIGFEKSPLMMLYHINLGFPVVDDGSRLVSTTKSLKPLDDNAKEDKENYAKFTAPVAGTPEKCYMHTLKADEDGNGYVGIVNESFNGGEGIGCYTRIATGTLPRFIEWKTMSKGEYVVGTEPTNLVEGNRAAHREAGTLVEIGPGEVVVNELEIGALTNVADIKVFEEKVERILGGGKPIIE
jgi:Domain of unknown function (DUF4432)